MQDAPSTSPSLPANLPACHALIAELSTALGDLQSTREQLTQENSELNLTIQKLLARLRGHRSERHDDPDQQQLDFGDDPAMQDGLTDAAAEQAEVSEEFFVRRKKQPRKVRNEQLPAHLPRYEVIAPTTPDQEQCATHGERQLIGYDTTETLEFERPKLRVRVTKYPKFACPGHAQCGVQQPPRPTSLVEGNRFDTSVAAEIVVAKYAYHLPVYRQQDLVRRQRLVAERSTLLNILAACAAYVLEPLGTMPTTSATAPVIPTDETNGDVAAAAGDSTGGR